MNVKQISTILNSVFAEALGEGNMIAEDLRNIVDAGRTITSSTDFDDNFENYAKQIVDKVGRTIFVDRVYKAKDLGLWRDAFEYGSVLEKLRVDVGAFSDNAEWDLTKDTNSDGVLDYNAAISTHIQDLFKFYPARVQAKYFNAKTTFKNIISLTRKQLRSAFSGAADMAKFIGMIENAISKRLEIAKTQLQKRVLVNLMGEKIYNGKYVDLKALYEATGATGVPETLEGALSDKNIVRFIAQTMSFDREMMAEPSTLYTDGTFITHTPEEDSRLIVLADLDSALKFNLYGDTYNEEFVKLNNYKTVPFWQENAKDSTAIRAAINVTTSANHAVNKGYILGVLFDRDAAMICNEEPEVRTQYNADGNFTNYIYAYDCSYYNDFDENALVYTWGNVSLATVTATLAKGTNDGTTKITATVGTVGDSLYCLVDDDKPNIVPGLVANTTGWTELTSGTAKDNITASVGQYMTVIEVDTAGVVVGVNSVKLTSSHIK